MDQGITPTLYIRLRKRLRVAQGEAVLLGQAAQMIVDPPYENQLQQLIVYEPTARDGNLLLIDMLMIVRRIKQHFPEIVIEHFGEPHVLVEIAAPTTAKPNYALLVLVWVLLFIGSGLAIMNFHADVSMFKVHRRIYELVTGRMEAHPLLLQIPYSFGIGVGMVLFFNHLFKKKFNEEPSPLEVEIFLYQQSVNQYVITQEYGKIQADNQNGHGKLD